MSILFFVCRVSLGERLQREESSGVIRSTGSSSGEKEITFQVEKVKKGHLSQFNVTGLTNFYNDSLLKCTCLTLYLMETVILNYCFVWKDKYKLQQYFRIL